jgi:hypothetical protein
MDITEFTDTQVGTDNINAVMMGSAHKAIVSLTANPILGSLYLNNNNAHTVNMLIISIAHIMIIAIVMVILFYIVMNTKTVKDKKYVRRMAYILYAIDYLGRFCSHCKFDGFTEAWFMDFHHKDPSTKLYDVKNTLYNCSFERHRDELNKCILICGRCHRKHHANSELYITNKDNILSKLEQLKGNKAKLQRIVLTEDVKTSINKLSAKGFLMKEISIILQISYDAVRYHVKTSGIKCKSRKINIPGSIVVKLLNAKYTIRGIAKKLSINRETLRIFITSNVQLVQEYPKKVYKLKTSIH